jgi:hypothetical protein
MLAKVAVSMVALHLGQAYPTYSLQGYSSVPAVPELEPYGALKQAKASSAKAYGALSFQPSPISHSSSSSDSGNYIADTQEVASAKQEFMATFRAATNGLLGELAPGPVQDTAEVASAKQEFFRIFESALSGMIETRFMRDTAEVRARKDQFFGTFDSAVTHLINTVEVAYLEDTAEVQEAKARFGDAFADAEAGIVGRQYIEDTSEVQQAKARFFKFFQFAVDGLLYKLNPVPGNNVLPAEIADFYIRDDADVATAKTEFDQLYRDALGGDLASAIALTVLEENDRNYGGAVEELEVTLKLLEEVADEAEEEDESKSDNTKVDFEVIDALLDAIDLDEEDDS